MSLKLAINIFLSNYVVTGAPAQAPFQLLFVGVFKSGLTLTHPLVVNFSLFSDVSFLHIPDSSGMHPVESA